MGYGLPKSVTVGDQEFAVRYDYRVILDIFEAMNDPELNDQDRALAVLQMFYPSWEELPDFDDALRECMVFINGGKAQPEDRKAPNLVSWEQDYPYIVAPINRVLGYEVRAVEYDPEANSGGLHWWTFLAAYYEIGDCLFAQIVRIRDKKARGKPLDKADREFYRKNQDLINIKTRYSEAEKDLLDMWTKG
jgi:hypothetical protein